MPPTKLLIAQILIVFASVWATTQDECSSKQGTE